MSVTRLCAIGALVLCAWAASAGAGTQRVMSLNLCTDQLLLAIVPASRIASVTWLARDPEDSIMAKYADSVAVNHGAAEEVVRDHPDLVLAGTYATPATRDLLKKIGIPVLEIEPADSFDAIRRATRKVAAAVGEPARGEALIAHMDEALAELERSKQLNVRVAAWDGAGFSARPGSLYDNVLIAAGARNVINEAGALTSGSPDVEALLATAPTLLVRGMPGFQKPGMRQSVAFHPLVTRFWRDRTVFVPRYYYVCGSPFSADAALSLRTQMDALLATASVPLPFVPAARQ
jgi:iron complex transport system substrate-binding protein